MDEKVFNAIISDYAMEVANLKITVITLRLEIEKLKMEKETKKD